MRVSLSVMVAVLLPHCGGEEAAVPPSRPAAVAAALCDAAAMARDGDVDGAREAFQDRAHIGLHEISEELADTNRAMAEQLALATSEVEQALLDGADGETLAARIDGVRAIVSTSAALRGETLGACA